MDRSYLKSEGFKNLKHRYKSELQESFRFKKLYDELVNRDYKKKIKGKKSSEIIADSYGVSERTVKNRLRYTYLIPELFEAYANNKIKMHPMTCLSYLNDNEQKIVVNFLDKGYRISLEKARILKKECKNKNLTNKDFIKLLSDDNLELDTKERVSRRYKVGQNITISSFVPADLSEDEMYKYTLEKLDSFIEKELLFLNKQMRNEEGEKL